MLRNCKLLISILLFVMMASSQASVSVSVNPVLQNMSQGDSFSVAIAISGLNDNEALGGYDLDVTYDASLLNFTSAVFGDPSLGDQLDLAESGLNLPSAVSDNSGKVNLIEFTLDDPADLINQQAKNFILATLFFDAIDTGFSSLTISVNDLVDSGANSLPTGISNGSVSISAIPIPASVWLFGSALVLIRTRRNFNSGN